VTVPLRVDTPRTAAIYCRVSTTGQEEDGTSLATQEERCRQYAATQGYLVNEDQIYHEVHTGTELWQRPKLTTLRAALRHGCVTHLIVYAIDRLSRDPVHLGIVLSEAEHHGGVVEFVSEPLDHSPEGQLIRFVRGYAARIEVEKIRERALRGKRARLQNGKIHNFGLELYGYRRDKARGGRVVYEPEAAIVRAIFHWYTVEKMSVRSIIKLLHKREVPPPSVSKGVVHDPDCRPCWGKGQIHRILREPAYKGMTVAWRYDKAGRVKPASEWLSLPAEVTPALVSLDLWEAAQRRRASNTGAETRNQARPSLLRGLVVCAVCGKTMRLSPESRGRLIYRCPSRDTARGPCGAKRVPAAALEQWAWDQVCEGLRHPARIMAELERQRRKGPDPQILADKDAAQRALTKLERQQAKLLRAFRIAEEETFSTELLRREMAQIKKEKAAVATAMTQIEARLAAWQGQIARLDRVTAYCQRVTQRLESFDFAKKRLTLEALDVTIIANGRTWRITGSIPDEEQSGVLSQASWG
jgi:site-specific DNA recombinase